MVFSDLLGYWVFCLSLILESSYSLLLSYNISSVLCLFLLLTFPLCYTFVTVFFFFLYSFFSHCILIWGVYIDISSNLLIYSLAMPSLLIIKEGLDLCYNILIFYCFGTFKTIISLPTCGIVPDLLCFLVESLTY